MDWQSPVVFISSIVLYVFACQFYYKSTTNQLFLDHAVCADINQMIYFWLAEPNRLGFAELGSSPFIVRVLEDRRESKSERWHPSHANCSSSHMMGFGCTHHLSKSYLFVCTFDLSLLRQWYRCVYTTYKEEKGRKLRTRLSSNNNVSAHCNERWGGPLRNILFVDVTCHGRKPCKWEDDPLFISLTHLFYVRLKIRDFILCFLYFNLKNYVIFLPPDEHRSFTIK